MGLRYAIGGSIASSAHGTPRFTQDADIAVERFTGREAEFAGMFGADYYVSMVAIEQANQRYSTFNIIHLASGFKVDIFVQGRRAFDQSVLDRHVFLTLPGSANVQGFVASPEDILLLKLEWYRLGNESSDRQWGDIQGLIKAQRAQLDLAYLETWAQRLGVDDLLVQSLNEP